MAGVATVWLRITGVSRVVVRGIVVAAMVAFPSVTMEGVGMAVVRWIEVGKTVESAETVGAARVVVREIVAG